MKITKRIISLVAAVAVLATMFVAVPVSAATETVDILNWNFDNETPNTAWDSLKLWTDASYATDGFYGAEKRGSRGDKIVEATSGNYLQVSNQAQQIEFKNVGVGQTEATASLATDTADKFGADSIFGTPYYVEFKFMVPATTNHVYSIFNQHFEGTLDENNIISSGPNIMVRNGGTLAFADDETAYILANGSSGNVKSHVAQAGTWHTLKVYVDPAARTYQVWFDGTAVQKVAETGTEPTAFKFGPVYNTGYGETMSTSAGAQSMSNINGTNINTYLANKNQVLAPNRTYFQTLVGFSIDDLHMYRVTGEEDPVDPPVEPEEPEEPGVVVPEEGDVINWTFDSETTGNTAATRWAGLSIWNNTTDGFYGAEARYDFGRIVDHTAAGKSGKYFMLRITSANGSASTIQFKNVGKGQTESNVVDSAEYFGADSLFGKPYYVDFDFHLNVADMVFQLFGQHFEGTLADGTAVYTSGPAVRVTSTGYLQFANGFAAADAVDPLNVTADSTTVKQEIKPAVGTWHHLKIYVDPINRTYQVWFNDTPVQLKAETGTEPTAFEFGAVQNNAGAAATSGAGNTDMMLIGGKNPNKYLKDAGIILAPNRTRFQTSTPQLSIDDLHIYYPAEIYTIPSEIIAAFNAANNGGAIAEGTKTITLPGLPSKYDSEKYTVSWSSSNDRINTETGALSRGTAPDAVLTVTVSDGVGTATAKANVSLPFDYTSWVPNPVDYEIGGIKFKDAGVTEDAYIYSPVAGGKLSSVQFKNNTGYGVNLIAAAYDADGRLAACKVVGGPDDGEVAIDLDIPATATNPVVKFFVWSADDGITPLATSAQVFEEAGRKLFILSDSLYDETPLTNQNSTGIGAALKDKFNTTNLPIVNLAECGATLKRFATEVVTDANTGVTNETRFHHALSQIQPGDYVLMSFGHNDTKTAQWGEPEDATTYVDGVATVGSFTYFYQKYVEAIRLAGGIPIIATPVPRCEFDAQGNPTSSFGKYIANARTFAADNAIPFLEVNKEAKQDHATSLKNIGKEEATKLYVGTASGLVANDYTHVNEAGAEWVANIIVELVNELKLPFAKYAN